jgi:hypothetical protein
VSSGQWQCGALSEDLSVEDLEVRGVRSAD